ncbi:alpha/beta fold hydrolase [Nonomuraea pusilla]|uniref:Thioesterase domain-containing protein n=1 Tax=Nonomuraea pusilla TaxID=46177 RepID=A0A1H7IF85_9ACTN|nr:alpha/beta fold hydrolase [Nonomuraea pusilla]SEK60190.1 Thioesterase domain-containing protein [Nonomuraea pusilla]
MTASRPSSVAEKRRAVLDLRLRREREEALARQGAASGPQEGRPGSPLVPLRPAGAKPPLFLVHAAGGSVAPYVPLAPLLGDDQPVHALEDPGLRGAPTEGRGLTELAAAYLAAVREVQPEGPLRVGGWSVGGAVALEMARQDGDVALTFALDTAVPDEPSRPGDDELSAWFAADAAAMGAEPGEPELAERFPVFAANVRALLAFRPSRVDGRVVLLCAEEPGAGRIGRWRAFADETRVVPGDHYTMLRPPHVEALADVMRDELSEVNVR